MSASPNNPIRRLWDRLAPLPGGRRLFSIAIGRLAPYTGSIGARVEEMAPGYARVVLRDRRRVRNHLDSIHAIALANLGELATGLALHFALPPESRAILVGISIEYVKKARGRLVAEGSAPTSFGPESEEIQVETQIRDEAGEIVATLTARWLVGPRPSRG